MKSIVVSFFVVACAFVATSQARPDQYTTKYDNFDVDKVLSNHRLFMNYMNCLLEKGKCTPEGTELRGHIGEALETDCGKCSPKQKEVGRKVLKHVYEKEKESFKELEAKYDPTGKYRARYEEDLKKL